MATPRPARIPLICLSLASLVAMPMLLGCPSYTTHVESDTALGRVVVYRSGIAFYERRAKVKDGVVNLTVPHDKVNDFLKSLTVADAKTGESLPVSYPTRGATRGSTVDMKVQVPKTASDEVVLTYIAESPAWKPTYRVIVEDQSKVFLQGWAIVDNTSGEDWNEVRVGVGSSSAMSFRYDLRSVRNIHRETLRTKARFAVAPPRGGATHGDDGEAVAFELADADIPLPPGHPNRPPPPPPAASPPMGRTSAGPRPMEPEMDLALAKKAPRDYRSGGSSGARARYKDTKKRYRKTKAKADRGRYYGKAAQEPAPRPAKSSPPRISEGERRRREEARQLQLRQQQAETRVAQLAQQLSRQKGDIVIEGFAKSGERNAHAQSLQRANTLRNQLIRHGVAPGRLRAVGKGVVRGHEAGVRIVNQPVKTAAKAGGGGGAPSGEEDAAPVGESHFESDNQLTVNRGTSAMVSILSARANGDVVYLYDAKGERGNSVFAFKSVRFKNPTESTLEAGPVTVYGEGRFIGEGLTEPIPPDASAIVPFALDRQVVVDSDGSFEDRIAKLFSLQRGVLTTEVRHTKKTKLRLVNRLHVPTTVFIRHSRKKGWKLDKSPEVYEKLGRNYLFAVKLGKGETKTVEVHESTPLTRTIDLRSDVGLKLVRVYLQQPHEGKFATQMKKLLGLNAEMDKHRQAIENLRVRMGEYRARVDELHTQIVSLREAKLKAGGSLLKHLQKKMQELSESIQKATMKVVDHQQQLTLARVRFQDGVAELTLEKADAEKVDDKAKGHST